MSSAPHAKISLHGDSKTRPSVEGHYTLAKRSSAPHHIPSSFNQGSGRASTGDGVTAGLVAFMRVSKQNVVLKRQMREMSHLNREYKANLELSDTLIAVLPSLVAMFEPNIQIFVINLDGKTLTMDVNAKQPVLFLKWQLYKREKLLMAHQRLRYGVRDLSNECSLEEYGIGREATLRLACDC